MVLEQRTLNYMNKKYRYNHLKNGYSDFLMHTLYKYKESLKPGLVVDVGCGHGRNLKLLKEVGFNDLLGIDILNRVGEVPGYVEFIETNIEEGIPVETESSELTLFNYVYMFLREDAQAFVIKELLRITKSLLVIETYTPKHDPKYFYPFKMSEILSVIKKDHNFVIENYREKTGKMIARRISSGK